MVIKITNVGPIKFFNFDLDKDLHIIYGKNNIGKSYAISIIYIVLKAMLKSNRDLLQYYFQANVNPESFINDAKLLAKKVSDRIVENPNAESISIKNEFESIFKKIISDTVLASISESFKNSYSDLGSMQGKLSNIPMSIEIVFSKTSFTIGMSKGGKLVVNNVDVVDKCNVKYVQTNRTLLKRDGELRFYVNKNEIKDSINTLSGSISEETFGCAAEMTNYLGGVINDVFFLPASRSGLYEAMNIFSSVFARLSQLRHLINEKIDIPALSDTMSDYFLNLSTIKIGSKVDAYSELASKIENEILDASITFNEDTKKLEYYNARTKMRLDLSETSSMVSEIAPIVAYLKYIINEEEKSKQRLVSMNPFSGEIKSNRDVSKTSKVVFIEEPEAHLHPEVQIKLMDVFTKMIGLNVKIVMTTHSNYIFNKLNNLIIANNIDSKNIANYFMTMTDKGSVVQGSQSVPDEGVTDENFVEVSQDLYNERIEIISK